MPFVSRPRTWSGTAIYLAVLALSVHALTAIAVDPNEPDWPSFSLLLLLSCAATRLRVQLPGVQGPRSLAFLFNFAAITFLPALYALFIFVASMLFDRLVALESGKEPWDSRDVGYQLAVASVAVYVASLLYRGIASTEGLAWVGGACLAAAGYFVVESGFMSLRTGFTSNEAAWRIWNREYFWTSPLYVFAPLGVVVSRLVLEAEGLGDALLGLSVIGAAFWYLRSYFPRLHDQQDHAEKLAAIRQRALETLAVAIEAKDGSTAGHLQRVKTLAVRLGERLGCNPEEIRTLKLAAVLHDVGKVGVPDYILQKPSRLTEQEFSEIANHAAIGADIVGAMEFPEPVNEVVLSHHEHWDGSGYPRGIVGSDIPRLARILTVVDCFDALVSERPYRPALPVDRAVDLLREQRAKIFDPEILDSFLQQLPSQLDELQRELALDVERTKADAAKTLQIRQTWVHDGVDLEHSSRSVALQKLGRQPERLLAFYDVMSQLGADLNYERSLSDALGTVAAVCGASSAAIFLYSQRRDAFTCQFEVNLPAGSVGRLTLPNNDGMVGRASQMRVPLIADNPPYLTEAGLPPPEFETVECSMVAPLSLGERLAGVLILCAEQTNAFDEDQGMFVSLVTDQFSATLGASQQLRRMHIDAHTDATTHLPNARASFARLDQELNRARRQKQSVGVLFMDLNGMKPINDSYGHAAGDKLLGAVSFRLRESLRSYDFLGRIGGDEFLAVLSGISDEHLELTIEQLKDALEETAINLGDERFVRASISIGAALYPRDGANAGELIKLSDERMYEDKQHSRMRALSDASAQLETPEQVSQGS